MIRSTTLVSVVLAASVLSGCTVIDALENASMETHARRCDKMGFARGTDAFANCMLQQQAMDEASDERQEIIRAIHDR